MINIAYLQVALGDVREVMALCHVLFGQYVPPVDLVARQQRPRAGPCGVGRYD